MSKSKGNGIDPLKMCQVYGADILRLWSALVDYQADVRASEDIFKGTAETYRKIRNTIRFMLGNLAHGNEGHFNPETEGQQKLARVDELVLMAFARLINKVTAAMDRYDFSIAMMHILNFVSSDLSSFYCDITKDILYCEKKDSPRRLQVQTTYYRLLQGLIAMLTPLLPFTMEEAYNELPYKQYQFAQLEDYPAVSPLDETMLTEYDELLEVRDVVLKQLELARTNGIIGSAQEARIELSVSSEQYDRLSSLDQYELARYFIVSEVILKQGTLSAKVLKHDGQKCQRCWNYYEQLNEIKGVHVCDRCRDAIK
jgi:isoleucyl-tRNA synthetase